MKRLYGNLTTPVPLDGVIFPKHNVPDSSILVLCRVRYERPVRYHQLHAVALLGWAVWLRLAGTATGGVAAWVARSWVIGVVLFSGSLYWLALGGPRWLGPVTPLGGVALLTGWAGVIAAALKKEP